MYISCFVRFHDCWVRFESHVIFCCNQDCYSYYGTYLHVAFCDLSFEEFNIIKNFRGKKSVSRAITKLYNVELIRLVTVVLTWYKFYDKIWHQRSLSIIFTTNFISPFCIEFTCLSIGSSREKCSVWSITISMKLKTIFRPYIHEVSNI